MDVLAKYPVAGAGLSFKVSELDFVWLACYFDSNLRPIHAGICKGPRWTRWYEYGGVSWGGWPRAIKTVRRDQIGSGVSVPDSAGMVIPEVPGPETNFLNYEAQKEIEFISREGILYGGKNGGNFEQFTNALKTELSMFIYDPVQVKQWGAFCLLGYCTSKKPDIKYPFPFVELSKQVGTGDDATSLRYYYRQACTTHLMLQEMSMGGVRCCQMVPSFAPYMEALPHPKITLAGTTVTIENSDGTSGTLPNSVIGHANYVGGELEHGQNVPISNVPNVQVQLPDPGENSQVVGKAVGVIGSKNARLVYQKQGGDKEYLGRREVCLPPAGGFSIDLSEVDTLKLWMSKDGCLDSQTITLAIDAKGKVSYSSDDQSVAIPMN